MTSEIADWLGLDAGHLREGTRADLVVVRPEGLTEALDRIHEVELPGFGGLRRLVRRNDDAIEAVLIGGRLAVEREVSSSGATLDVSRLGTAKMGTVLRARH